MGRHNRFEVQPSTSDEIPGMADCECRCEDLWVDICSTQIGELLKVVHVHIVVYPLNIVMVLLNQPAIEDQPPCKSLVSTCTCGMN